MNMVDYNAGGAIIGVIHAGCYDTPLELTINMVEVLKNVDNLNEHVESISIRHSTDDELYGWIGTIRYYYEEIHHD